MIARVVTSRFAVSALLTLSAMGGLGWRLVYLHLGPHDDARASVEHSRHWEKTLQVPRGRIYDRMGRQNILALDLTVKHVCADPGKVVEEGQVVTVASEIADLLDLDTDAVAVRLKRAGSRYAALKRYVPEDAAALVAARNLPGIFFEDAIVRFYPQHGFMCHVIGFVNHEGVASAGIEQWTDRYLRGSPGLVESQKDAFAQEMYLRRNRDIPAVAGADVWLTLDQNIQYVVEKALDGLMAEHGAKGAWAIVQHVRTGEILAMASRPSFDLNTFYDVEGEDIWLNRAIGSVYEPGSTFKVATIAAALNEGTVTPDVVIDCENGSWSYAGRPLRDYHPHGRLTVADGLKKSSNILTAKVALTLDKERFHGYLRSFGVGDRLGIDLPGEERGILHPYRSWSKISPTRIAIGQGVAVTALQMLGVVSAIANDGFLMRPYVVDRVMRENGELLLENKPEVLSRPVSAETAATMRRLLARVTEQGGTGTRAAVDGYRVAGKTGTAQKPVNGAYSSTAYMASFAGFLPASRPEIAVIVVVDEPQPVHTGGRVAAPAFAQIASNVVCYLDIAPDGPGADDDAEPWQLARAR